MAMACETASALVASRAWSGEPWRIDFQTKPEIAAEVPPNKVTMTGKLVLCFPSPQTHFSDDLAGFKSTKGAMLRLMHVQKPGNEE